MNHDLNQAMNKLTTVTSVLQMSLAARQSGMMTDAEWGSLLEWVRAHVGEQLDVMHDKPVVSPLVANTNPGLMANSFVNL